MDFKEIFSKFKDIQDKIKQFEKELVNIKIVGESCAGDVKVYMNGDRVVEKIEVTDEIWNGDKEITKQLIAAATNDALEKIEDSRKEHLKEVSGGMNLPNMFF